MATLMLRRVGSSFALEGFAGAEVRGELIEAELWEEFGEGVASIRGEGDGEVELVLVDRRSASWDVLKSRILEWVKLRGYVYAEWHEEPLDGGRSRLQFHA